MNALDSRKAASPAAIVIRWLPWLIGGFFFALYALTAAPSIAVLFDDSLEFQLVLPTLGIAHPTGYPLYTLLGALWSRVLWPFGSWAWRVNLLSALAAGATAGLVFALGQRLASPPHPLTPSPRHPVTSSPRHLSPLLSGSTAALVFALVYDAARRSKRPVTTAAARPQRPQPQPVINR